MICRKLPLHSQTVEYFQVGACFLASATVRSSLITGSPVTMMLTKLPLRNGTRLPCPSLFPGNNNSQGLFDIKVTTYHDVQEITTTLTNGRRHYTNNRKLPCQSLFPGSTNRQDFFDNRITTNYDVQEITQKLEDFLVQFC